MGVELGVNILQVLVMISPHVPPKIDVLVYSGTNENNLLLTAEFVHLQPQL